MRRFVFAASLIVSSNATMGIAAADPAGSCVQPVARFAFAGAAPHPEALLRLIVASGTSIVYSSDHTMTIASIDRGTKAVTIYQRGENVLVMAEQLRVLDGSRAGFLYDRPGALCPLDQLPKELQSAP